MHHFTVNSRAVHAPAPAFGTLSGAEAWLTKPAVCLACRSSTRPGRCSTSSATRLSAPLSADDDEEEEGILRGRGPPPVGRSCQVG